ncbi:ABC transporter substrate-binding protein [Arcobacter sp.]|uniref:ABC transporter substrate-binding protein n=1 Tax=Arcobacter sp. TaxID=1872629 RepID=UPI003D0AB13F
MKIFLSILILVINLQASERVVTLSPSINEIVYSLGVGKNVVANTKYCSFPEESKSVKKVGGYATISLEKILSSNPSVVISQDYDEKLLKNLKSLNIKTLTFKTASIEDIRNTIFTLGNYFKKEEKAKELISSINNSLASIAGIVKDKKILVVISPKKTLSRQIYVSGNYLYFEDIIKASGNVNAFQSTSKAQPVLNTEKIININPDIIILLAPFYDGKTEELNEIKKLWLDLPINAAKNKDVYAVDKLYAGIPSQRVVYFIEDFKKILENVRNK